MKIGAIPKMLENAYFGLLLFPSLERKKIRNRVDYYLSFYVRGTKKSSRPKTCIFKHLGYIPMVASCLGLLSSCSPVRLPVGHQYQLTKYSVKRVSPPRKKVSILVVLPDAVADYGTEQMLYMNKPFKLMPYAHNAWTSPPAKMLYPLILRSLEASGYFSAVVSSPYAEEVDYRLDTQVLSLYQNFLKKPSEIDLSVKVVLTRVTDNKAIASRIITKRICSPIESPYGGVIAANKAAELVTAQVTDFTLGHIRMAKNNRYK